MVDSKRKTPETPRRGPKGPEKRTPGPDPERPPDEATPDDRTAADRLAEVAAGVPAVADRLRLVSLDRAGALGAARERALAREEARRLGRFGAGGGAVAEAAARSSVERRRQTGRRAAVRRFETGLGIGADDAVVMGQVRTPDGRPLVGVHVAVSDERGPKAAAWAHATTDDAGFYEARSDADGFRKHFRGSDELVVTVTGGPIDATHTEIRPLGTVEGRVRVVDVDLPGGSVRQPPPEDTAAVAVAVDAAAERGVPGEGATRVYLAAGARGGLVQRLQARLAELGCSPGKVDGDYGSKTAAGVAGFQEGRGLRATGEVDGATWRALFDGEPPSVLERSLQVTASFEGHGFTRAAGNWDGAGITWGIIGFTLRHGALGEVVRRVHERYPELLAEDFGPQRSATLLETLDRPAAERLAWADSISLKGDPATLHKPWREAFAAFGARPEVQAAQLEVADEEYAAPARRTAEELGLASELGFALAFDAHVQNGGVKKAARERIAGACAEHEPDDERALRRLVAHAVADQAIAKYRSDVLARKLTLADGEGRVHGQAYDLRSWGLGEAPARRAAG